MLTWDFEVQGERFAGQADDWSAAYSAIQQQAREVFDNEFFGPFVGAQIIHVPPTLVRAAE